MRLGIIGLECDDPAKSDFGLFRILLVVTQDCAKALVRLGVIGLECDGLAEGNDCVIQLPLLPQGDAEVVVRLGIISGLSAIALRQAASASASFFCLRRAMPRLWYARARSGWRAMALR